MEQAIAAENVFHFSSLAPAIPATLRQLADLRPLTLAVMHGASYRGDGESALRSLADAYEAEFPVTRLAVDADTATHTEQPGDGMSSAQLRAVGPQLADIDEGS